MSFVDILYYSVMIKQSEYSKKCSSFYNLKDYIILFLRNRSERNIQMMLILVKNYKK